MRGIDSNRLPQFLAVIAFFFPFTGAILMLIAVRATLTGPNIPEIVENGIPIQAMVEIVRQARFGSRNRAARRVTYVYADANGTKFTGTYVECDDVPKVGEHLLILAHSERFDESIALASQPFMEFAPNGTAYTKGAAVAVFFFFGSVIVGAALWIATITRLVLSLYS